jgi:GTP pyrophosphokinase
MSAAPNAAATPLSDRFTKAVMHALVIHADQRRKGSGIPYAAHLLSVAAIVVENGGGEDEAVAAILHDAVEDQGGAEQLGRIRELFGERVAEIVLGSSDTDLPRRAGAPKEPWRLRKERHLAHIAESLDQGLLLVIAADKLHNARSILEDLRKTGLAVYDRFNAGRDGTLWYYREMAAILKKNLGGFPAEELERVVGKLERKTMELACTGNRHDEIANPTACPS